MMPGLSFSAWVNQQLVGCLFTSVAKLERGQELIIEILVIENHYRNQGIGTKLMQLAEKIATGEKLVGIRLLSNPRLRSHRWYHSFGLKSSGWVELVKTFPSADN